MIRSNDCRFGGVEILSAFVALGLVLALTFSVDLDEQLAEAKRKVEMKRAKAEQVANPAASQEELRLAKRSGQRLFVLCGAIAISAMVLPGEWATVCDDSARRC